MGSVGLGNNGQLGAFLNRIYPEGLDLGRSQINQALGVFVADPTNTFRAGMCVMRNSSGLIVPSDGTDFLGVAKWNHSSSKYAVVVNESIVLNGVVATNLAHGGVANVKVTDSTGVTVYTVTTDYTVSAINGTVTRVATGSIGDGDTVLVTYTWLISEAQLLQLQGKNFWNTNDEVSAADGRVTVITQAELIFTTQYDTSKVYTITGSTSNLYASTTAGQEGLFTSSSAGSAVFVGRVFQVPTASDPFLGLRLVKQPFAV
jgi:hypothetical protein